MAVKSIRIGGSEDIVQYDDGDYAAAVETTEPIRAGAPVVGSDVLRKDDIGGVVGDVLGPAASTDNALARFNGAIGKSIQNSLVTADDSGSINIPSGQDYEVGGTRVITNRQAAEGNASTAHAVTDWATTNAALDALGTKINNLLAKLRTHGLIAP